MQPGVRSSARALAREMQRADDPIARSERPGRNHQRGHRERRDDVPPGIPNCRRRVRSARQIEDHSRIRPLLEPRKSRQEFSHSSVLGTVNCGYLASLCWQTV